MALRLIFMGTPDFAAASLEALLATDHSVVAVYTRAPKKAGRGMQETLSPVHQLALKHNIPVLTPPHFKDAADIDSFSSFNADLAVVAAYGLILPQVILDAPRLGCWNIHASLLPRWRGAAPIQRAIMAGDQETGISIMQMALGLDTGPVWSQHVCAITQDDTAGTLHDKLMILGAQALCATLSDFQAGRLPDVPVEQDESAANYATKINKAEAAIDWQGSAAMIAAHINGLSPFPGAWCYHDGQRLKILQAQTDMSRRGFVGQVLDEQGWIGCGEGAVLPVVLQRAGKPLMPIRDFQNGRALKVGDDLTCSATN
jgi:methionyl-tRNA formyltransferase